MSIPSDVTILNLMRQFPKLIEQVELHIWSFGTLYQLDESIDNISHIDMVMITYIEINVLK